MKPTIGRIVHYTIDGAGVVVPAIVVKVYTEEVVNIRVFTNDGENPAHKTSVKKGEQPGCWNWPPRE